MLKIGITGNIASGKSMLEEIIANSGYMVIDLDIISHKLLEKECKYEVLKEFNTTNRKELGKIVFADKNKLKKLENIIHPKLRNYILNFFEENKNEKAVFISGALIYNAGFDDLFDKIIFVDANKELRLKRLIKRNFYDEKTALMRIEAQNNTFKNRADFIVENNTTKENLKKETLKVLSQIKL